MNAPWNPRESSLSDKALRAIARDGFAIVRGLMPAHVVAELSGDLDERFERIGHCDGPFLGRQTKRIHGLLTRSERTARFVLDDTVLEVVERVLEPHCDHFHLNLTQAIEIDPGERAQAPHRDQGMFQIATPGIEYLVNIMWPLTEFTADNGATRFWPGTHRQPDVRRPPIDDAVITEMQPGDALIYLGSVIHGAGANISDRPRRGLIVSYALGWLKQLENMSLTYPPEIARTFPRQLTELLGYRRHIGSLGHYDGQCPSVLLEESHDESRGATEIMSNEQVDVLERFAARQDWS